MSKRDAEFSVESNSAVIKKPRYDPQLTQRGLHVLFFFVFFF